MAALEDHPTWFAIHVCGSPDIRGRVYTRQNVDIAAFLAYSLGASRLYAPFPIDYSGPINVQAVKRALRRFGFISDDLGAYLPLEGKTWEQP